MTKLKEWVPVNGYEDKYELNKDGVVRTLERVVRMVLPKGERLHPIKSRIKHHCIALNGYITIALCKNNRTNTTYLHRIIAEAFIMKPPGCNVVNHKNGIKTDNRIENLEWTTSSENNSHAIRTRLRKPAHAVLNEKLAIQINEMRKQGLTIRKIATMLNLSNHTVGEYVRGHSYKWIKI